MDDRNRRACVVGFMSTVQSMIPRHIDTHSWFTSRLRCTAIWTGGHCGDACAETAARAAMRRDGLFPLAGMQASVDKIDAIYKKAGAADRFAGRFYDVPHQSMSRCRKMHSSGSTGI